MSVRRRPKNWKPLIPGFWPLVATLLLAASIFGFYAALGHFTTFKSNEPPVENQPLKAP
tara:strand:- start:164 stop:340 length:177 start_codon:yes stop_codon:yes gene_type:complete